MKPLFLTIKKEPFDVMETGEKREEYRRPSDWIKSRLMNPDGSPRQYDKVLFVNGYGADRPAFRAKYNGFEVNDRYRVKTYSNGLSVAIPKGWFIIKLGEICP